VLLAGAVAVNALDQESATAIHSVAMDWIPKLPIQRRTIEHIRMYLSWSKPQQLRAHSFSTYAAEKALNLSSVMWKPQ